MGTEDPQIASEKEQEMARESQEFTMREESYIVSDRPVDERFFAEITPREGFFDVEVYKWEYEYEYEYEDFDDGVYGHPVAREPYEDQRLHTRELTVDNVRTVLKEFEITLPDSLAKGLTEWQEKYWDGNEIDMVYEPVSYSELVRSGAFAEPQELIERDGYSELVRGGSTIHYIVDLGDYAHVKIEPTQGVFDVEVNEVKFAEVTVFPDDNLPAGVVPGEAYIAQHLKRLDVSVEDVQKTLAELNITIPDPLVEKLSEWQREFLESPEYADEMDMAAAEAGDNIATVTDETAEELKGVLTKIIFNDMSAIDAKERWVGTTELALQTLSRADLVGIEAVPKTQIMVQALRDIAEAERAKEPHVIAEEALKAAGHWRELGENWEVPELTLNQSPDDRFLTSDTYGDAVALMEAEGIAKIEDFSGSNRPDQIRLERSETVQERKDRMKASLYETLEGIREMGEEAHHSVVPTLSIAVMRAQKTLVEHEHDLRFSTQSLDVRVMELAMRTIGGSNQTPTYQAYPWVRADVVDIGVNAFKDGVEFLNKLVKQGVDVESEGIGTLAEMIRQEMGSSHAQLSEMVAAIVGAAIDEVNSMSHSVGQEVSSEPQKANEVGQRKRGIGIGL